MRNTRMYIEEITIEGFKSYAQRVVVPNFDPYFNAITGLNGSGKSNILDSICFVLGITNLSQVRKQQPAKKGGLKATGPLDVSKTVSNAKHPHTSCSAKQKKSRAESFGIAQALLTDLSFLFGDPIQDSSL